MSVEEVKQAVQEAVSRAPGASLTAEQVPGRGAAPSQEDVGVLPVGHVNSAGSHRAQPNRHPPLPTVHGHACTVQGAFAPERATTSGVTASRPNRLTRCASTGDLLADCRGEEDALVRGSGSVADAESPHAVRLEEPERTKRMQPGGPVVGLDAPGMLVPHGVPSRPKALPRPQSTAQRRPPSRAFSSSLSQGNKLEAATLPSLV